MQLIRVAVVAMAAVLVLVILWAAAHVSIVDSFARIVADPWGIVTIVDLYIGLLVFAVVVARFEPNRWLAGLVILASFGLGNVVTALWLAARAPRLWRAAHAIITKPA